MTTTEIDLKKFCSNTNGRYALDHPYVHKGFRYACDGRIALMMPATGDTDDLFPDGFDPPNIAEVITQHRGTQWTPWPVGEPYEKKQGECLVCDGSGKVSRKVCEDCDGYGAKRCPECGHEKDCVSCDGAGQIGGTKCPNCEGKGYGELPRYKIINQAAISVRFGRLIEALPNVEYSTDPPKQGHNVGVCFRFTGGEGIVMPILL